MKTKITIFVVLLLPTEEKGNRLGLTGVWGVLFATFNCRHEIFVLQHLYFPRYQHMFVRRHWNCTSLSISTMFSQLAYRLCKPAALLAGAALIPSVSRFSAFISGSVTDFLSECSMHYQQIMSLIINF